VFDPDSFGRLPRFPSREWLNDWAAVEDEFASDSARPVGAFELQSSTEARVTEPPASPEASGEPLPPNGPSKPAP
jgi:hypothetical protein